LKDEVVVAESPPPVPTISYFSTKLEIDQLLEALDENGVREKKLIHSIQQNYSKMTLHMNRIQNETLREIMSDGNVRRSTRVKSIDKVYSPDISFLTYVNKYSRG
jgi:hypothetical protein